MTDAIKNDARPRVSVVMAVFNGERHVREAIESILAQTFEDFEFIIIDDGSSDGTPAILEDFAARDRRLRLLQNETNQGIVFSANRLLGAARGELVARTDHDDWSHPDRLRRQVAFFDENPDFILVGSGHQWVDDHGRLGPAHVAATSWYEFEWMSMFFCPILNTSAMFRSTLFLRFGQFCNQAYYPADPYEYFCRASTFGKASNMPDVLVRYRRLATGVTRSNLAKQKELHGRIAATQLRRVLPQASAVFADMDKFYACFYSAAPITPDAAQRVKRAIHAVADDFAASRGLGEPKRRALRRFTTRWLIRAFVFRSGMWRRPLALMVFGLGALDLVPDILVDVRRSVVRRAGAVGRELPTRLTRVFAGTTS